MNILAYMQKIGRALMVPVATLPAAAILMGVGYWIDPAGWGSNNAIAAFLLKSGAAIIDNMPILFAIGVAYGMSKDKDGAAALTGFVGYLVVTTLLAPESVSMIRDIPLDNVPVAFGKINTQFIGILVGIISAELYNRFSHVELPPALSFFSGRRLVPIITSFIMIIVAFILMWLWPHIYNPLVSFGNSIKDLDSAGAGIYGFFNRLLIPVGLHHALNSVFWFDVAGINDIPNFLGGQQSINTGKALLGITGRYQAGFFPIMMFGLPGAALAFYHTARSENRARVASIMIAASFASFFTGITEPLEFSFMFIAPILYIIHALLTGLSLYIAAAMEWISGFGFSAGLVDMILSTRNPLAVKWYMLLVQGGVFFLLYYTIFRFMIIKLNLNTLGRNDEPLPLTENTAAGIDSKEQDTEVAFQHQLPEDELLKTGRAFIEAVGGQSNLTNIDACITRLRLEVKNADLVDENAARELGAAAVVKLNTHSVQVILGPRAEKISDAMRAVIKQSG